MEFADNSPLPPPSDLYEDNYVKDYPFVIINLPYIMQLRKDTIRG